MFGSVVGDCLFVCHPMCISFDILALTVKYFNSIVCHQALHNKTASGAVRSVQMKGLSFYTSGHNNL